MLSTQTLTRSLLEVGMDAVVLLAVRAEYDGTGNLIYLGQAAAETAEGDAGWLVRRIDYNAAGDVSAVKFADHSAMFNKVWDNRAGYTY